MPISVITHARAVSHATELVIRLMSQPWVIELIQVLWVEIGTIITQQAHSSAHPYRRVLFCGGEDILLLQTHSPEVLLTRLHRPAVTFNIQSHTGAVLMVADVLSR